MSGPTDADFGYPAWIGFIQFIATQRDAWTAFTAATGLKPPHAAPPPGTIEAIVDEAAGYAADRAERQAEVAEAFVLWATETMWGVEDAPPRVRAAIEARRASSKGDDHGPSPLPS